MLTLHQDPDLDRLVEALAGHVAGVRPNPMQPDRILVPTRAVAGWLSQRLTAFLPICANLAFETWDEWWARLAVELCGADPERDPFRGGRLAWAVAAELNEIAPNDPDLAGLATYLAGEHTDRRRVLLARQIADLLQRTQTLRGDPGTTEGEARWLGPLWHRVLARIEGQGRRIGHGEVLTAVRSSQENPLGAADLRVFGLDGATPAQLEVLAAAAAWIQVDVFHRTASPAAHDFVSGLTSGARLSPVALADRLDREPIHPLLVGLGRIARELEYSLHAAAPTLTLAPDAPSSKTPGTLLEHLQHDIRSGTRRGDGASPPVPVAKDDRSILFHRCHSPIRQLEVLRDELMRRFEDDHTLQPRDVLVLCADLPSLAPHIGQVFDDGKKGKHHDVGGWGTLGFPHVPYEIADRSEFARNQVADALLRILELPRTRFETSTLLDLLALDPVRRRFGLSEEQLAEVSAWVGESAIRWGRDADHREAQHRPKREDFTWRLGLDRLLLGMAIATDGHDLWEGLLPVEDVEASGAVAASGLIAFAETLLGLLHELDQPRSAEDWGETLSALLDATVRPEGPRKWQEVRVRITMSEVLAEAKEHGVSLDLDAVRAALATEFDTRSSGGRFAAGGLTFANLAPHRAVPHRIVALVGLDMDSFPRRPIAAGFDHVAATPAIGDGVPHERDRHAFLGALLSARDALMITWAGRSARTNAPHPMSVVASELLDELAESFRPAGCTEPKDVRAHLTVDHPLHPFDVRCFRRSDLGHPSVDGRSHTAAVERSKPAPTESTFWRAPLAPVDPAPVEVRLQDLSSFLANPTQVLLKRLLRVEIDDEVSTIDPRDPLKLDGLESWKLRNHLTDARLEGRPDASIHDAVVASGQIPLGETGAAFVEAELYAASLTAEAVTRLHDGRGPERWRVSERVGGLHLHGRIDGLVPGRRVWHTASDPKDKYLVQRWLDHLVLCAFREGAGVETWLVGKPLKDGSQVRRFAPVPRDEANQHVETLVGLYLAGQCRPLPFSPSPSRVWLEAERAGASATEAARLAAVEWEGDYDAGLDPHLQLVFGPGVPLGDLSDRGIELPAEHRFEALARTIFQPLLDHLDTPAELP